MPPFANRAPLPGLPPFHIPLFVIDSQAFFGDDGPIAQDVEALDQIEAYRTRFDAAAPEDVSLLEASGEMATEDAWEPLSEWETLERRVALLDAARRGRPGTDSRSEPVDA